MATPTVTKNGNTQVNGNKLNDKQLKDINIVFEGEAMIVPEGISFEEARRALTLREHEENVEVSISETVRAFPLDGAVALQKALADIYGWTSLVPTPGFFGDKPPQMVSVEIGYNKTIQVPWGRCRVPRIDGEFITSFSKEGELPIFRLEGIVKRKDEKGVTRIAQRMREIIAKDSIYKGKAISINFRDADGDRKEFSPSLAPKFMDLSTPIDEPIFSKRVGTQLQTCLYNPIMFTDHCVKHGIPLKRGVLLEGTFGTGKTLTAHKLSRVCVEHGWTYIYLEDVRDLDIALGLAKLYQPAVIFAEDVDGTTNNRDIHLNKLLNTLDGVDTKGHKIMVVLTTNNLNTIHPAFVRPGRIDSIVQLTPPDSEAMVRIARQYSKRAGGGSIITGTDEQIREAFRPLVGANAAFVREAVDFSKLSAVANSGGDDALSITSEDISAAVTSMLPHVMLINPNHGADQASIEGQASNNTTSYALNPANVIETAGSLIIQAIADTMVESLVDPSTLTRAFKRGARKMNAASADSGTGAVS